MENGKERAMAVDRRRFLGGALGGGLGAGFAIGKASTAAGAGAMTAATLAGIAPAHAAMPARTGAVSASAFGLDPSSRRDQTARLQRAIDQTSGKGLALALPPGTYRIGAIRLRPGTQILGTPARTLLRFGGGAHFLMARNARDVRLEGLVLDGAHTPLDARRGADGLLSADGCAGLVLADMDVRGSTMNGLSLRRVSGHVTSCTLSDCAEAGLFSLDASGLTIAHNHVQDCANNGILVWRSAAGEDGTLVLHNRIERIGARSGGSGQNGNGINLFRAGACLVSGNRIADCAFSAIRANGASNVQILANNCTRLGEVALYAEFAFEGAVIADNLVDGAATGIAVTNFDRGGRLAVVQGNLLRNLTRREAAEDKRGNGISVEADTVVSANVIEKAENIAIAAGWGRHMRDVMITSNLLREARIGIGLASDPAAGAAYVTGNMIASMREGAIRAMDFDRPIGPDLARASAEPYPHLTIFGNVAR